MFWKSHRVKDQIASFAQRHDRHGSKQLRSCLRRHLSSLVRTRARSLSLSLSLRVSAEGMRNDDVDTGARGSHPTKNLGGSRVDDSKRLLQSLVRGVCMVPNPCQLSNGFPQPRPPSHPKIAVEGAEAGAVICFVGDD